MPFSYKVAKVVFLIKLLFITRLFEIYYEQKNITFVGYLI